MTNPKQKKKVVVFSYPKRLSDDQFTAWLDSVVEGNWQGITASIIKNVNIIEDKPAKELTTK